MTKTLSLKELRMMTPDDLRKEVAEQRKAVAQLRLHLRLGKEKGGHLLRRARRGLARMLTVLHAPQSGPERVAPPRSTR